MRAWLGDYQVMPLGLPYDLSLYKLLTDWGSFIAGILALAAGVMAYLAGVRQANATREAVANQLDAEAKAQAVEVLKVRTALRAEIVAFAKFVMGALETCRGIATGETHVPMADANAIVRGLYEPTIFPAVAGQIAVLDNPHVPVQFYLRIEEAKSMANTFALATDPAASVFHGSAPVPFVTKANAQAIADCLITALQLGRAIVADVPASITPAEKFVTDKTLEDIDAAMAAARETFPDAESFKLPYPG